MFLISFLNSMEKELLQNFGFEKIVKPEQCQIVKSQIRQLDGKEFSDRVEGEPQLEYWKKNLSTRRKRIFRSSRASTRSENSFPSS